MTDSTSVIAASGTPSSRNLPLRFGLLALVIALELLYIPINRAVSGGIELKTPLDDSIPLWAIWAVPYLASIVWWTAMFIWAAISMPDDLYRALIKGMIGIMLVSYAIYLIFPTFVTRPELISDDWATNLVRAIYTGDRSYCAFPSGHTYATMFITLFWWRWKPQFRPLWAVIGTVVILSTLFTKQHYLPDLVGGIAMAYAGYYGGLWLESRRVIEGLWALWIHNQRGYWGWRIGIGAILALALSTFVVYARLPVDGATGDLESFTSEGFEIQWLLESREDGLQVGDLIVRADGYTVDEWLSGAQPSDTWRTGGTVDYDILRDGKPLTLPIDLRPALLGNVVLRWASQLLLSITEIALGVYVFLKRKEDLAARLFALYVVSVGLHLTGDAFNFQFGILPHGLLGYQAFIEHFSFALIFTTLTHFALVFPVKHPLLERRPRLVLGLIYATMPLMIAISMIAAPSLNDALRAGNRASLFAAVPLTLLMCAAFFNAFRSAPDAISRAQIRWMVWALAVASLIGLPGYIIPIMIWGQPFIPHEAITLISIFVPTVLALAITRYKLFEIEVIINRTLVYGALTVLLGLVFLGTVFGLQEVFKSFTGGQQSPFAIGASALVIGALFQPIRRRLQTFVDRRFYGIRVDYSKQAKSGSMGESLIGRKVGSVEVVAPLGRGGMAEVYLGRHATLNRSVAVKILPAQYASDQDFRRRFEIEARTVAGLRHPSIVQLYDFGEIEGSYFMVMEFLEGQNLDDYLKGMPYMQLSEALPILADVAKALDYAHAQGLVHRDVKPSNIMLQKITATGDDRRFRAVLTDFGIAKVLTGETGMTQAGVIGTLDYMAPEQIRAARLDGTADIYAMGAMAFRMLTGQLPFEADNPGTLVLSHLQTPPPDPASIRPDLPPAVSAAILRALAKDPAARFVSAEAFVAAMDVKVVAG